MGLGWGPAPLHLAKACFGHLDLDLLSLGCPCCGVSPPWAGQPRSLPASTSACLGTRSCGGSLMASACHLAWRPEGKQIDQCPKRSL